jgi:hypothetical protein
MDPTQQFWWNWGVSFCGAVATVGVVLVALFGEFFRSKLFSPVLQLQLLRAEGEKGKIFYPSQDGTSGRFEDARYYHVQVSNKRRRLSPAQNVQVFLTRVEEPGPDAQLQVTWLVRYLCGGEISKFPLSHKPSVVRWPVTYALSVRTSGYRSLR